MAENKGKIDVEKAMEFLGDHIDAETGSDGFQRRYVLCGHVDNDPKGVAGIRLAGRFIRAARSRERPRRPPWPKEMKMWARMGHPCGEDFLAAPFAAAHPEFAWQLPYLRDMKANPWTLFAGK